MSTPLSAAEEDEFTALMHRALDAGLELVDVERLIAAADSGDHAGWCRRLLVGEERPAMRRALLAGMGAAR